MASKEYANDAFTLRLNVENAKNELNRLFFSDKSYDLGDVGRYKINNKFRFHNEKEFKDCSDRALREIDIIETLKYFVNLINEVPGYNYDDIDHWDDWGTKITISNSQCLFLNGGRGRARSFLLSSPNFNFTK